MLSYAEFKDATKDSINDYLPQLSQNLNYDINILTTIKNNNLVLDGLTIKNPFSNLGATIYLNQIYELHKNGYSFEECLEEIAQTYEKAQVSKDFDLGEIMHWDAVKDNIVCKLVSGENNEEYLCDKVHQNINHLAIIYSINIDNFEEGCQASVVLTQSIFDLYDVSKEELHQIALKNTERLYPCSFTNMENLVCSLMFSGEEPVNYLSPDNLNEPVPKDITYVLTNTHKFNGASVILYPNVLDAVGEKLGDDFFIIPSSIHEVLIIPKNGGFELEHIEAMVNSINNTEVEQNEILSYRVFEYDVKEHLLFYESKDNKVLQFQNKQEQKKSIDEMVNTANNTVASISRNDRTGVNIER